MVPVPGANLRSRVRVYHKDQKGVLHSLQNFDFLERVLDEVSEGNTPTKPRFLTRADRERMKKIGVDIVRPTELDIVIEFPWHARTLIKIVAKANDEALRRQVLVMALDRIRGTPTLRKILATKGLPSCTIRENPYLEPGHAPYEKFIESLLVTIDAGTPAREKLLERLLESAGDEADEAAFKSVEKRGVRTVFHGTNHSVMDAILNSGLDPSYRYSDKESDYFGVDYSTSLDFTKRKTRPIPKLCKLLVFMVIVEPTNPVPSSGAVTVASNRFQLPVAEITLDYITKLSSNFRWQR